MAVKADLGLYATANGAFLVDFRHRARAPQCVSFKRTVPHKLKGAPIARGSRRHGAAAHPIPGLVGRDGGDRSCN